MKQRILFSIVLLSFLSSLRAAAQLSVAIQMDPNPSPYISDWRSNPNTIRVIVTNPTGNTVQGRFSGYIEGDKRGRVAETIIDAPIPSVNISPGTSILNAVDAHIIEKGAVRYLGSSKMDVMRSGKLPDDNFKLCVQVVQYDSPHGQLSNESCTRFDVKLISPPSLIAPANNSKVAASPSFQWSVVPMGTGTFANYELTLIELDPGQTNPGAAMQTNIPIVVRQSNMPIYQYLASDPLLDKGHRYAWRVRAFDPQNRYTFANEGRSEVWAFTFGERIAFLAAPSFVNDGIGEDIDYWKSKTSLSANWAAVPDAVSYLYAIGSTVKGTEILNWTDNGLSTSVTKNELTLNHKQTYYISVRAKDKNGETGTINSSDGVTIDVSNPSSMVEVETPPGRPNSLFINIPEPTIKWSGIDDVSPVVSYDIEYQHENDVIWNAWQTNTSLLSAKFPSKLFKGDGRYMFRSRARDAAGNQSDFNTKPEAETTIDTKFPISAVMPLPQSQTSTDFVVSWGGTDEGTGIDYYEIQVKDDYEPWKDWLVKQTNTSALFKGVAGHRYDFRSRAVDMAGNVEEYPSTEDATTQIPAAPKYQFNVTATSTPPLDRITYYQDQSGCSSAEVTYKLTGSMNMVAKIDEAKLIWLDENGNEYHTAVQKISPPIMLNTGDIYKEAFCPEKNLEFMMRAMSTKQNVFQNNIDVIFQGTITEKQPNQPSYTFLCAPLRLKVFCYKTAVSTTTPIALNVEVSPTNISYAPNWLSNSIDVKLHVTGPFGTIVTLDEAVNYWYTESDPVTPFKTMKSTLSPTVVLEQDETVIRKNITMTIDAASLQLALGGKNEAKYTAKLEYSGKDQNGNIVKGITQVPLTVMYYGTSYDWTSLHVYADNKELEYYPGQQKQDIQFNFNWTAFTTLTIDSYQETVIHADGKKDVMTWESLPPPLVLKPGPSTTTISYYGKNIYVPYILHTKKFSLPISIKGALQGQPQAAYQITFAFSGKDDKGKTITATTEPFTLTVYTSPPVQLSAKITPTTNIFDESNLTRVWDVEVSYSGNEGVTLDEVKAHWYSSGETFIRTSSENLLDQNVVFKPPTGTKTVPITQVIDDNARIKAFNDLSETITNSSGEYKEKFYKMILELSGHDDLQRKVSCKTPMVEVHIQQKMYQLAITSDPKSLTTGDEFTSISYTISSNVPSKVTLEKRVTRIRKGTELMPRPGYSEMPGFKGTVTDDIFAFASFTQIDPNGLMVDKANIQLNLNWLLGKEKSVECAAEVMYEGKDENGNSVIGKVFVPITVDLSKKKSDVTQTGTEEYILIPKVASVRTIVGATTVSQQGTMRVLSGKVQMILYPSPLDSAKVKVTAANLTFAPVAGKSDTWEVKSGTCSEEVPYSEEVFAIDFYKVLLIKVQKISFDNARPFKLLIDKARTNIPIIDKGVNFENLAITENGIDWKISSQEISAFGLTFRIAGINYQSSKSATSISLTTGLRLKGKPKSEEFAVTDVKIQEMGGKTTVEMKASPAKPLQLISGTNYLNFESFEFKDYGNDWVLAVEVSSSDLPLLSYLGKQYGVLRYQKSGKITGKLELIKETEPGFANDPTSFTIGKWAAFDVTYLGLEFNTVQKVAGTDTTFEFDPMTSFLGIAADLYIKTSKADISDPTNRIAIGDYKDPGIKIFFDKTVKTSAISLSQLTGKKLSLGPVYMALDELSIKPYPFELGVKGKLGVEMENVFDGQFGASFKITYDKNKGAEIKDLSNVGGSLSILKVVKIGINDISFSSTPQSIPFQKNDNNKDTKGSTIDVESYFKLGGASLNIGTNGAGGGGGFQELFIFTTTQGTNFVLKQAKFKMQNILEVTFDCEYIKLDANNEWVSIGGAAEIAQKYKGEMYGKIGQRDGEATWGFYFGVKGLDIPLGPCVLDKLGGGFFYRPSVSDINTVRGIVSSNFTGSEMQSKVTDKTSDPGVFAVFLCGGLYVGNKNLIEGQALMTITQNYWRVDAEIKALGGKAEAIGYLEINWSNPSMEGLIAFQINVPLIDVKKENNYIHWYVYGGNLWGIDASLNVKIFYIFGAQAKIYVGNQGFLFDFYFDAGLNLYVIKGGIKYNVMAWWKVGTSWGAYATVAAYGSILGGLIGAEIGLEAAFIGEPEYVIFGAGYVKVELLWTEVFEGRVWIAVGIDGFDGGTGRNSKYDQIIQDAKNIGKKMKEDMQKLADELSKARLALYSLNEQQALAAGNALAALATASASGKTDKFYNDIMAVGVAYRDEVYPNLYTGDLTSPYPQLEEVYTMIWSSKSQIRKFENVSQNLTADSAQIISLINNIKSKESQVKSLLAQQSELIKGELPGTTQLAKHQNPVGSPNYKTITIKMDDGSTKTMTVKTDYPFDETNAKQFQDDVEQEKKSITAYHTTIVTMAKDYVQKLKAVDELLYSGSTSVSNLTQDYASTFTKISDYSMKFLDALRSKQEWASNQINYLDNNQSDIKQNLIDHILTKLPSDVAKNIDITKIESSKETSTELDKLIQDRFTVLQKLVQLGGLTLDPLKLTEADLKIKLAIMRGLDMYQVVPRAAFVSFHSSIPVAATAFRKSFQQNNNYYMAKWNAFTVASDQVYDRKVKLFTLLYDLVDNLSMEAGTREGMTGKTEYAEDFYGGLSVGSQSKGMFSQMNQGQTSTDGKQFQQQTPTKTQAKKYSSGDWDFEGTRKYIKKLLLVPNITMFSGSMLSDYSTLGYAKLSLNWNADHPAAISEYSFAIPNYSEKIDMPGEVSSSDQTSKSTESKGGEMQAGDKGFQQEKMNEGMTQKGGLTKKGESGEQKDKYSLPASSASPTGSSIKPWWSVASSQNLNIPFVLGVHKPGNYEVWIRARGAGGYTLERLGTVNIQFALAPDPGSNQDFGKMKKQSTLNITDNTPPTTPNVDDLIDTASNAQVLIVKWSSIDYESGIQEYQYKVVTALKGIITDVTQWISAGGQTDMIIRLDLPMKPGEWYFVQVKAKNGAGMWSKEGMSDGVKINEQGKVILKGMMK